MSWTRWLLISVLIGALGSGAGIAAMLADGMKTEWVLGFLLGAAGLIAGLLTGSSGRRFVIALLCGVVGFLFGFYYIDVGSDQFAFAVNVGASAGLFLGSIFALFFKR